MAEENVGTYQRYVDLGACGIENPEANAKAQAWLNANGINPESVPAHQYIQIVGDLMEVTFFYLNPVTAAKEVLNNPPRGYRKIQSWCQVTNRPEEFGI